MSGKHPLLHEWTLFFDSSLAMRPQGNTSENEKEPPQKSEWGSSIKKLWDFDTVEDFWRLFNNLTVPHELGVGCGFFLFKKGIEPRWEDENNHKGGRWTVIIPKNLALRNVIDTLWLNVVLAAIGETLENQDNSNQICGCVVNIRKKEDKISLWIRDASDEELVKKIGKLFKASLELAENAQISFRAHYSTAPVDAYTL